MTNTRAGYKITPQSEIPPKGIKERYIAERFDKTQELTPEQAEAEGEASVHSCCARTKRRSDAEVRKLMNRLKRIEGQIRGIEGMLEKDAYCPDIMIQVSAVNCALNSFNKELLAQHIRSCVVDDIKAGKDESIDELVRVLQKVMK